MSESNSSNHELPLSPEQQRKFNKSFSQLTGMPVDHIEMNDDASPEVEGPKNPPIAEGKTFRFGPETQDAGIPETARPRGAARELNNLLSTNMQGARGSYNMTESRRSTRPSLASLKRIYENCLGIVKMNELDIPIES